MSQRGFASLVILTVLQRACERTLSGSTNQGLLHDRKNRTY